MEAANPKCEKCGDVLVSDNTKKTSSNSGREIVSHSIYAKWSSSYSSSAPVCKPYINPNLAQMPNYRVPNIDPALWALAYSSSTPVYKPPTEEDEIQKRDQNMRTSQAALKYYNKKHHTAYALVDAINSGGIISHGLWYHCNFTAKSVGDLSTKLFFAELKVTNKSVNNYLVTACRILQDNKTRKGCEKCGGGTLLHPTHGFRQGLHQFKLRTLRPRRNK